MITNDQEYSVSIKQAGYFATKYSDAFTEYLDHIGGMRMLNDTWTGNVEAPMGSVVLMGKRLVFHDERGFVCHDKYPSERAARAVYDAIDAWYCAWDEDDDDGSTYGEWLSPDRQAELHNREAYVRYVIALSTNNANPIPLDYDTWVEQ